MINNEVTKQTSKPNFFKKAWLLAKTNLHLVVPFLLLIFVVALFFIISLVGDKPISYNLPITIKSTIPYIIAAFGTLFVTAMAGTDITQGSLLSVFISITSVIFVSTGSGFLSAIIGIVIGLASGFILGFVNAKLKVPSFMVSLGLLMFLRALSPFIGGTSCEIPDYMHTMAELYVSIPVTIVLFLIIYFLFHKTPFGTNVRAIGENENAVIFAGVKVTKIKIIAFMLSGLFTAVAGFFYFGASGTTAQPSTTGLGFEMSILIAIFLGGIPVQGGFGCKAYMIFLGAFTIAFIEKIFALLSLNTYYSQLIKGFVLIGILLLTAYLKHKKNDKENGVVKKTRAVDKELANSK